MSCYSSVPSSPSSISSPTSSPPPRQKRPRLETLSAQSTLSSDIFKTYDLPRNRPSVELIDRILGYVNRQTLLSCCALSRTFVKTARQYLIKDFGYDFGDVDVKYMDPKSTHESSAQWILDTRPLSSEFIKRVNIEDYGKETSSLTRDASIRTVDSDAVFDSPARVYPSNIYQDNALPNLCRLLRGFESLSISAINYTMDWTRFQEEEPTSASHYLDHLFANTSLGNVKLRGIKNFPISSLKNTTALRLLSLSTCGLLFPEESDEDATKVYRPYIFIHTLQLKGITFNAAHLKAYLDSTSSTVKFSNLQKLDVQFMHKNDVDVAVAVLNIAKEIEELRLSTRFHHFEREESTRSLHMDNLSLSGLHKLQHLHAHLSFREGHSEELDWLIDALFSIPESNPMVKLYLKLDIGPTINDPFRTHEEDRDALTEYPRWEEFKAALRRLNCSGLSVDLVVCPLDDSHADEIERCWTLYDCVPGLEELKETVGKLRTYERPVFTVARVDTHSSFVFSES